MKLTLHIAKLTTIIASFTALTSCATYHEQVGSDFKSVTTSNDTISKLVHEVVIVGDAGNADDPKSKNLLSTIDTYLKNNTNATTLLFIGDNIYPLGMPDADSNERKLAEEKLNHQLDLSRSVNGKTVFLAGNHDWYNGLDGLIAQKDYVEGVLGKKSFMPRKYDAVDALEVNDQLTIITIDSEWFIQNWDRHPNINVESFIKTREDFFEEFRSLINKNQNKITLIAIHHPMISNGGHGGYFSARKHLFPYKNIPLPILGSIGNYLRKTSGASPADTQHTYYRMLIDRLTTLTQNQEQVVFVSGHEHNLQYIESDGIKQVISGSASKTEEARSLHKTSYSIGELGFATIQLFENNKVNVNLNTVKDETVQNVFQKTIVFPIGDEKSYGIPKDSVAVSSVYSREMTEKSAVYKYFFGSHYRSIFGTAIQAPVADLSTLYGGLSPIISGGGNQSLSLRLQDANGRQYVMRGLKKSTKQFLQSAIFKDTYVKDKIEDTFIESFIDDFYTTSHPYTPFIVGKLSDEVNLYHTNPKLYYVPKQNVLGKYNDQYGDQLYMIEERPHKSQKDILTFGKGEDIIGTTDVLQNLEADEKYTIDTEMYLRARIFDFLIGDWDRHADQWRWVEKTENKHIIYQPIPRDRDQAFAKIDGALLKLINKLPALRHMQNFEEGFSHPRWINKTAFPLDKIFLQQTTLEDWKNSAQWVSEQISDEVIKETFNMLPSEVKDQYTDDIIEILKARRIELVNFVEKYHNELMKFATVVGTNKKDKFEITTEADKITVNYYRIKKDGEQLTKTYTYTSDVTKEIWVYGLDDDDVLMVNGSDSSIQLKLIGGRNNDVYDIHSDTNIKIFDYKSKNNTFYTNKGKKILKDQYAINQYDYRKVPLNTFSLLPNVGYNKDNGVMIGVSGSYEIKKFNQNPFTQKHTFGAKYDFATSGIIANYVGKFKDYSNSGFWSLEGLMTSSNFSRNFFGLENMTYYDHEAFEDHYYRVRTSQLEIKPSYEWKGRNGSSFLVGATYESTKIEKTNNRLVDQQLVTALSDTYNRNHYLGARMLYQFSNYDNTQEPTVGLGFSFLGGTRHNLESKKQSHQYIRSKLNWVVPITKDKRMTWSSSYVFEKLVGDDFHFYQAASIGSNNGLRGYRQQRFIGHTAMVSSQDIRFKMKDISNSFLPLSYGIYAGYDVGRIWSKYDLSNSWKHSYGGGVWFNALESFTAHLGVFSSKEEDVLFNVGLGFTF